VNIRSIPFVIKPLGVSWIDNVSVSSSDFRLLEHTRSQQYRSCDPRPLPLALKSEYQQAHTVMILVGLYNISVGVTYMQAMERARCCGTNLQAHLEAEACVILETRGYQPKLLGSRPNVSAQPVVYFRFMSCRANSDDVYISRLPSKPPHDSMT
jgi:hypothetical protein